MQGTLTLMRAFTRRGKAVGYEPSSPRTLESVERADIESKYFSTTRPKIYKKALAAPRDEEGGSRATLW